MKTNSQQLQDEFDRIKQRHRLAFRMRVARAVLGPSVIRVFTQNTKPVLLKALLELPVDELTELSQSGFRTWYETQLKYVATQIRKLNSQNSRVLPGIKWGHSGKVLSLFLRDLVIYTRYFEDVEARKIEKWLYVPVDSFVIKRLALMKVELPFQKIREIDSSKKFYFVQSLLQDAAAHSGIPPVWFDDVWADRE